jgi:hypothetical protein
MREIIQRHLRLNGVAISVVEFGLIALCAGAYATYTLLYHQLLMAVIAVGIALNCVPVIVYGLRELAHHSAKGERRGTDGDTKPTELHHRKNPDRLRDTILLSLATLLPFVILAAVLVDVFRPPSP